MTQPDARPAADPTADAWHWRAHYTDGKTTLDEYTLERDEHGVHAWRHHGFAEVDLARVAAVELVPNRPNLPHHWVLIDAASGQRPIFFRRPQHYLPLGADGEPAGPSRLVMTPTVLGWQRTIVTGRGRSRRERNIASFTAYLEDGGSFITDDRQALIGRLHLLASGQVTAAQER